MFAILSQIFTSLDQLLQLIACPNVKLSFQPETNLPPTNHVITDYRFDSGDVQNEIAILCQVTKPRAWLQQE